MRTIGFGVAFATFALVAAGAQSARAEGDAERPAAPSAPVASSAPATPASTKSEAKRRPAPAGARAVPGGAVVYDKPVMRNGRLVLWRGAWRDRKGGAAEPAARPGRDAPSREPVARERDRATPAARTAAVAPALTPDAAPEPQKAVRVTIAVDPVMRRAVADLGKAVGEAGVAVAAAGAADQADLSIVYGPTGASQPAPGTEAVTRLYDCEFHVLTVGGARSVADLSGARVDLGAPGSAGAAAARRLFELLKVSATFSESPPDEAMRKLGRGDVDAAVVIAPRGLLPAAPKGARLVSIPYAPALRDTFLPTEFSARDYPQLTSGEPVDSVSAPALLVARDAGSDAERAARLRQFTESFFQALPVLGAMPSPLQSKWQDVNPAAHTGLPRVAPAQAWVDKKAAN